MTCGAYSPMKATMTKHNYQPPFDDYRMVYIELREFEDDQLIEVAGRIQNCIYRLLPYTFVKDQYERDEFKVLASNEFSEILVADNGTSVALILHAKDPRTMSIVDKLSHKLFHGLARDFEVHKRTGPWTTRRLEQD